MRTIRYWGNVLWLAGAQAGQTIGIKHPKRWPLSILAWLIASCLSYQHFQDANKAFDAAFLVVCGLVSLGVLFILLLAWQVVLLPPELDAQSNELIAAYEQAQQAVKPEVGPIRLKIDSFAERADELREYLDVAAGPDEFHNLREAMREYLIRKLMPDWIEAFDDELGTSRDPNANPTYWLKRLEAWARKCAHLLDESGLLAIDPQRKS